MRKKKPARRRAEAGTLDDRINELERSHRALQISVVLAVCLIWDYSLGLSRRIDILQEWADAMYPAVQSMQEVLLRLVEAVFPGFF